MVAAAMVVCALSAAGAATVHKKKGTSKAAASKTAAKRAPAAASKTAAKTGAKPSARRTASSTRRNGKRPVANRTTWRNRQMAPTPERYREIQQALVAKGYLKPEDVSGGWNQSSIDALKSFQAAQSLEATGKINSLSLIALGLGPKRDTAAVKPVTEPAQSDQ